MGNYILSKKGLITAKGSGGNESHHSKERRDTQNPVSAGCVAAHGVGKKENEVDGSNI